MTPTDAFKSILLSRPAPGSIPPPVATAARGDRHKLGGHKVLIELRRGDENGQEKFVRKYSDVILDVAWRLLRHPEEACHAAEQVFLGAFRAIRRFRSNRNLSSRLQRIAVDAALAQLRRASRCLEVDITNLLPAFDAQGRHAQPVKTWSDPRESADIAKATKAHLQACLERLPLQYHAVLVMRDMERLSTVEAAKVLGISQAAVKLRLNQARLAVVNVLGRSVTQSSRGGRGG